MKHTASIHLSRVRRAVWHGPEAVDNPAAPFLFLAEDEPQAARPHGCRHLNLMGVNLLCPKSQKGQHEEMRRRVTIVKDIG